MKEEKARVEDAMHATKAAVEEGIFAGGGVAIAGRQRAGRYAHEGVEGMRRILRSMPRSRSYPTLAAVLALGTPAGLLLTNALLAGRVPTVAWVMEEIARFPATYAYLTLSTVAGAVVFGCWFGGLFDRLLLLSNTDPLTGLLNRRCFGERLADEARRARRYGHALSVLCLDIDRLKAINDGFGHKAGDHALEDVCRILLKNVRAIDAVARLGGDEFAVLLPETSAGETWALSQRILTDIGQYRDALTGRLAISIGISELSPATNMESDGMLVAADTALYRVKAAGGGHTAIAQPEAGAVARATPAADAVDAAHPEPDTCWSVWSEQMIPGSLHHDPKELRPAPKWN